ncbi:hypothetical protein Tco_0720799 [Tanacetum coccineum]
MGEAKRSPPMTPGGVIANSSKSSSPDLDCPDCEDSRALSFALHPQEFTSHFILEIQSTTDVAVFKTRPICMTRSLIKELFTPFKDPEQEFRSSRKLLKTLSLDESRSLDLNIFSNLKEYFEEKVTETMAETMEQYMSKTRADYGSGIARPKIDDKDSFELKGQFLKELRDNTFSGSDHEDANEHIEKDENRKVNYPTTAKDCPPKKVKPEEATKNCNFVDLSKEGDIEQQLWDSTKETMQTLHIKNEDNQWKKP